MVKILFFFAIPILFGLALTSEASILPFDWLFGDGDAGTTSTTTAVPPPSTRGSTAIGKTCTVKIHFDEQGPLYHQHKEHQHSFGAKVQEQKEESESESSVVYRGTIIPHVEENEFTNDSEFGGPGPKYSCFVSGDGTSAGHLFFKKSPEGGNICIMTHFQTAPQAIREQVIANCEMSEEEREVLPLVEPTTRHREQKDDCEVHLFPQEANQESMMHRYQQQFNYTGRWQKDRECCFIQPNPNQMPVAVHSCFKQDNSDPAKKRCLYFFTDVSGNSVSQEASFPWCHVSYPFGFEQHEQDRENRFQQQQYPWLLPEESTPAPQETTTAKLLPPDCIVHWRGRAILGYWGVDGCWTWEDKARLGSLNGFFKIDFENPEICHFSKLDENFEIIDKTQTIPLEQCHIERLEVAGPNTDKEADPFTPQETTTAKLLPPDCIVHWRGRAILGYWGVDGCWTWEDKARFGSLNGFFKIDYENPEICHLSKLDENFEIIDKNQTLLLDQCRIERLDVAGPKTDKEADPSIMVDPSEIDEFEPTTTTTEQAPLIPELSPFSSADRNQEGLFPFGNLKPTEKDHHSVVRNRPCLVSFETTKNGQLGRIYIPGLTTTCGRYCQIAERLGEGFYKPLKDDPESCQWGKTQEGPFERRQKCLVHISAKPVYDK